jgi:undecaprenyl-diphosphatase
MSPKDAPRQEPDEETQKAAEGVRKNLEEVIEEINTPEEAQAVAEELAKDTRDKRAVEVAEEVPYAEGARPEIQARVAAEAVEEAAEEQPGDTKRAAAAIEAAAAQAAALEGTAYEAVAEAAQEATRPSPREQREELERSRRLLREALVHHPSVGLLQAYDTELFVIINNNFPRTRLTNTFFHQLSLWFTGGWAWLFGVAFTWPFQSQWAKHTLKLMFFPIVIPTLVVEGPIKKYFRRRRPYIDLVRAIVVGKKPGNWSFPSGHSASAFAGARMLARFLPRWQAMWYTLAGLVGFSRIYLGAHYPGDVITGSLFGFVFAEVTRWLVAKLGLRSP